MKRKIEIKEVFRGVKAAFPSTVPIFFGWIFVALTYGVLMEELGYGPLWTLLFSMICFCGGMQIAAVPMMAAGFAAFCATMASSQSGMAYATAKTTR